MARVGASLKNVDRFLKRVLSATDLTSQAARRELYRIAEEVMADSKDNYVPVDTGNLRSTGKVVVEKDEPQRFQIGLTFGDSAVQYALIVHEDLSAHHPVGQAKYLTTPLAKVIPNISRRIVAAVNKANRR